ncbi:MAG: phosphoribosylaminoimidazolesuccinocarboxamide synthase [Actinobacteria bacterium]|nr:MAG: phosphoribosylaminoimidazolesuccinocarboxamide synthase [Actinomycetota bacterium]
MKKETLIYEGKAKKVYSTPSPDLVIHEFKNDATAFDGQKKGTIEGKGTVNAKISAAVFKLLEDAGVTTHFKELLSDNEMLTYRLDIILVEVVVRNIAAGSLAKRLGYPEGRHLKEPIVEFYYKNDELGDPLINDDHIAELGIASKEQLAQMRAMGLKVNDILKKFFDSSGLLLVDFKLEFGTHNGALMLADEVSPDTCRLWDKETLEKLDKDRFRRDLGKVEEAYQEVLKRVESKGQGSMEKEPLKELGLKAEE